MDYVCVSAFKYEDKGHSSPKHVYRWYRSEITVEFKMPFTSVLAVTPVMSWAGLGLVQNAACRLMNRI